MADTCSQLSHLRYTVDSIITGLEVNASNFARVANDMVHLHKEEYVLACFKDKVATQSVVSQVMEFLQSWGLEVGPKLVGSDLFAASSSSSEPPAQSETAAPSEDVQMREVTPALEASSSSVPGAPVVEDGEIDGEGEVEEEPSGALLSTWLPIFRVV